MSDRSPRGRAGFELQAGQLDERQRAFVERVTAGPRGRVPINLQAWLRDMPFAEVVEPFGLYVSEHAAISKREKEITVLVNARFWRAAFEWAMHERHALKAGIEPRQVAAIREGRDPGFTDEGEALTWRLAEALHESRQVPEDLYQQALSRFGHAWVFDRIGLIGLYTMIAMTLNFFEIPAPPAEPAGTA